MNLSFILFVCFFCLPSVTSFTLGFSVTTTSTSRPMPILQNVLFARSNDIFDGNDQNPGTESFLKHVCVSCQYVYDEAKGFKKRYPPGTRFKDLKTFNCPVCGKHFNNYFAVFYSLLSLYDIDHKVPQRSSFVSLKRIRLHKIL